MKICLVGKNDLLREVVILELLVQPPLGEHSSIFVVSWFQLDEFYKYEMRDLSLGFAKQKILVSPSIMKGDKLISLDWRKRYQNIVHEDARGF